MVFLCLSALALVGCRPLQVGNGASRWEPSNDRDWKPEQAVLPYAEIDGSHYRLRNIRDCEWVTKDDFVVNHVDREIDLSQIQSVDFVMVPFGKTLALAHTMLSFGLDDGTWLGISVEVRKEKGEEYNPVLGLGPKFELIYVMAEERDLISLRVDHYDSDVYVYPTVATPQQAQLLFANIIKRINGLVSQPEFYHLLTNNCTTNLKDHVNQISPQRIRENAWQVLLPGFSAEYAYKIGLLDNRIPYDDLESIAYISPLADHSLDSASFSKTIRQNRYLIERTASRRFSGPVRSERTARRLLLDKPSVPPIIR